MGTPDNAKAFQEDLWWLVLNHLASSQLHALVPVVEKELKARQLLASTTSAEGTY
jgi:hypothetical protein